MVHVEWMLYQHFFIIKYIYCTLYVGKGVKCYKYATEFMIGVPGLFSMLRKLSTSALYGSLF